MKNWKTTLVGLLFAGAGIYNTMVTNHQALTISNAAPYIIGAIGGLVAKDHDVTGGTKAQPSA